MRCVRGWMAKVAFDGATGRVAFDQFGRRRDYQLNVLEQRGNQDTAKVSLSVSLHWIAITNDISCFHMFLFYIVRAPRFSRVAQS